MVKYAFTTYETPLHAVKIMHNISHTYDLRSNQQQWFQTKRAVFKNIWHTSPKYCNIIGKCANSIHHICAITHIFHLMVKKKKCHAS